MVLDFVRELPCQSSTWSTASAVLLNEGQGTQEDRSRDHVRSQLNELAHLVVGWSSRMSQTHVLRLFSISAIVK
jgi:hypothetical protein